MKQISEPLRFEEDPPPTKMVSVSPQIPKIMKITHVRFNTYFLPTLPNLDQVRAEDIGVKKGAESNLASHGES